MSTPAKQSDWNGTEIAIIGMAGRFPGAPDVATFWANLCAGQEAIEVLTDEALRAAGVAERLLKHPRYVRAATVLAGMDLFDAAFFGFTPREAELLDPQHRLFLECAWEAVEDAACDTERYGGSVGVFAGSGQSLYFANLCLNPQTADKEELFGALISNEKDFLSLRVSYKLDLKGPSVSVQTSCSTSLAAVHLACQSLLTFECDAALAGGVYVGSAKPAGYVHQPGMIYSADGHCRAFDARASGTVAGRGVGVVVLKRLADALAEGDCVRAIIRGTAMNNDGARKVSFLAPSVAGQARVIAEAIENAGLTPEAISYIETHGTATALGDPAEFAGLCKAFGSDPRPAKCALGSVKTNIGHADAAAGIAGLIKTVLALEHGWIPPSLHFEKPNPEIDFDHSPFFVNDRLRAWDLGPFPRRAGVSAFGVGGTNVHVVLEEPPAPGLADRGRAWCLLPLSAKTPAALTEVGRRLARRLEDQPELALADAAYTLQAGRRAHSWRRAVVCSDRAGAVSAIEACEGPGSILGTEAAQERPVVFLFPGQGAQHPNMGRGIYESEPLVRDLIDEGVERLRVHLDFDLREGLFPESVTAEAQRQLDRTAVAQPALFLVEYALARLWMSWGIVPAGMIGHSLGEYVAACLSGVLTFPEALELVALRGALMQAQPSGAMLAVALPVADLERWLRDTGDTISLAAINAPEACTVSGPAKSIAELAAALQAKGHQARWLHTSHAFHSAMMEPVLDRFAEAVRRLPLRPPGLPYLSNLTGRWITAEEAVSPDYWVRHLRQPVQFGAAVTEVLRSETRVFLEVGPGRILSGFVRQHAGLAASTGGAALEVITSLPHPQERESAAQGVLRALGRLWVLGVPIDWATFHEGQKRHKVSLPTYPFERQRYWVEPTSRSAPPSHLPSVRADSTKRPLDEWFYLPSWKPTLPARLPSATAPAEAVVWVVLLDRTNLGQTLVDRLRDLGQSVVEVNAGERWLKRETGDYVVNPSVLDDYAALVRELRQAGHSRCRFLHLWSLTPCGLAERTDRDSHEAPQGHEPDPERIAPVLGPSQEAGVGRLPARPPAVRSAASSGESVETLGFYSLLRLAQALGAEGGRGDFDIIVLTDHVCALAGEIGLQPEKATLLGPCRVIPQEYENIRCRCVDISLPSEGLWGEADGGMLLGELIGPCADRLVAWRRGQRWIPTVEPVNLPPVSGQPPILRPGGVYLITGGLGGLGLELADYLARTVQARLVLVGRTPFPERERWEDEIRQRGGDDLVAVKLRRLLDLEARGAELMIAQADVCDLGQMRDLVATVAERFGSIHGVIHAAGVPGTTMIQRKSRAMAEAVLAPKVRGTLVLEALFGSAPLDFWILCSSLAAVSGGVGQADYAAANAFLDAFAQRASCQGRRVMSVNWDLWQEVGMGVATRWAASLAESRELALAHGMTSGEGVEVFARVLDQPVGQVLVSTRDLSSLLAVARPGNVVEPATRDPREALLATRARPALTTPFVGPRDDIERTVADVWQLLFGFGPIGVHDNFFELGGHSFLATQVAARLRDTFPVDLSLETLFQSPTVAELAAVLVAADSNSGRVAQIAALAQAVQRMSGDEVEALLAAQPKGAS
jgi:acyl transferase domain-containing protein